MSRAQPNFITTPQDWPLQHASRQTSIASTLSSPSDTNSINFAHVSLPPTPALSSNSDQLASSGSELTRPVQVSFVKGSRVFKLKYPKVSLRKDGGGHLKHIELSDPAGLQSTLLHSFPESRLPIPHLEQPVTSGADHNSRVSFLEEQQTVQLAQTLFQAQPQYTFESWEDCVKFQEALLSQNLVFTAGIAEAKSKGRGEECISQNLRVLRSRVFAKTAFLYFANSQRKGSKRYVSIPFDSIERIEQSKKTGRPLTVSLRPSSELLAQMKSLQVMFLDENDQKRFFALLCDGVGCQG